RMGPYIYGDRNGIHIMDLTQTLPLLDAALQAVRDTVAKGGRVLFVGTKRQAQAPIAEAAERCAQYFMNHRWLGGTLTNWKTVSNSIDRLRKLDETFEVGAEGFTKRERLSLERERNKLTLSLGGIREMGGVPDLLFVIDTNKEDLAVAEANKLGIPVAAVLDTNSDPTGIAFPIPGNDDASRAIGLYCELAARAALDGMAAQMGEAGFDIGEMEEISEEALEDPGAAEDPTAEPALAEEQVEAAAAGDAAAAEPPAATEAEATETPVDEAIKAAG
ncbi:MAG: 30S ribosomal protein S2, partial [Pseudomonadota bacterium]